MTAWNFEYKYGLISANLPVQKAYVLNRLGEGMVNRKCTRMTIITVEFTATGSYNVGIGFFPEDERLYSDNSGEEGEL